MTPLHIAAAQPACDMLQALANASGATTSVMGKRCLSLQDGAGLTPFDYAVQVRSKQFIVSFFTFIPLEYMGTNTFERTSNMSILSNCAFKVLNATPGSTLNSCTRGEDRMDLSVFDTGSVTGEP